MFISRIIWNTWTHCADKMSSFFVMFKRVCRVWSSHSVRYEEFFWDIEPCSPLKINRRFEQTYLLLLHCGRINQTRTQLFLPLAFMLVYCSVYFSALKKEATCSSETSVAFQRTTRRYIPEDELPVCSKGLRMRSGL
jgi:hypothetical protein